METVAKFPAALWQMPKACSAPRRGQLLMRSLMQLQPGRERAWGAGGLGARLQFQLVSLWRLLNPSRQVHNTWAEGLRDWERPGLALSFLPAVFSMEYSPRGAGSSGETRMTTWPEAPKAWRGGAGAQAAGRGGILPACPLWLGLPPNPARICLDLQEHRRRQALPQQTAVAGFAPGQGGAARAPFASFSCPCRF